MGVLGEMFPGRKILDEAGEAGDAQPWRLGPVDLENNTVTLHRPKPAEEPEAGGSSSELVGPHPGGVEAHRDPLR